MNHLRQTEYGAIVVGSGPNGLAAAITMQRAGISVLLLEAKPTIGGGLRTEELTLPGFRHDVCSAVHPMAVSSPFFRSLDLEKFGLEFIYPAFDSAHPFDSGEAAILEHSLELTAERLGDDRDAYLRLFKPLLRDWPEIDQNVLGPMLKIPSSPLKMAAFGLKGLSSATQLANKIFKTEKARGLWAGMAAHSIQPLSNLSTSAIGLVLSLASHQKGWPIPKGGSSAIANAMAAYFRSLGGKIETGFEVRSLSQLPTSNVVLFDVTPRQLLRIAGSQLSSLYRWQMNRFRYGMGVFKIDWALDGPIPFTAPEARQAGTLHLGNTLEEIAAGEQAAASGHYVEKPFVLLSQPSVFDHTRAPEGKHTAWAYCHVPHGSTRNMTREIEQQVERFAPGFRERILARHTFNTAEMEEYNPNYVGGDINGGIIDIRQLFTRPVIGLSPYRTSNKTIYMCSSSTPPGGGVHGMCGYHAARTALSDVFGLNAFTLT
jgi:phytoene dehydrogenase-like protein